jgi:hypothetical protein
MRFALPVFLVALATADNVLLGQESPVPTAQTLTVQLASGRKFTGLVDPRTSTQRLVLRFERPGSILRRPIEWERIVAARAGDEMIDVARLREVAEEMKSKAEDKGPRTEDRGQTTDDSGQETTMDNQPWIAAIAIDPRLANWDGDVETDGLIVDVFPLDAEGYLAAASGWVEAELFAQQRRVFHHAPQSRGETLERVERWTAHVSPADFDARGVRLKLPFGAVHPEFDLDWNAVGLVHVKFSAPGHGVFEDSRDAVRIRPFAPLRDELQMSTDRRFVPTEGVGRRD